MRLKNTLIDFFRNLLCLKKLRIFVRIYCQILRAYLSVWSKNLAIKIPKRLILANKASFERSLITLCLFFLSIEGLQATPGPSFISVGRSQGKSISVDDAYTNVEVLSFLFRDQSVLPFFNIKANYLDKGAGVVANVGGGVRYEQLASSLIYGLNAYYDYRETHKSSFNRLGLGLELLGDRFSFRANGYLPVGNKNARVSTCIFDDYIGDYFMIRNKYLTNRGGGDFLFDVLFKNDLGGFLRLSLGAYYFNGTDCGSKIFGPEYRVTADINRYVRVGLLGTYDKVFGNKLQAQITLTLPLGDRTDEAQGVFQRVQRNDLMILQDRCRWITNF